MTIATAKRAQLRAAYLHTFDVFATDRSEVADTLGVSKHVASSLLGKLEDSSLVCSTDVNDDAQGSNRRGQYKELTWQCWDTYDSSTREEAEARFDAAFPA
jgi:hypothetical protein